MEVITDYGTFLREAKAAVVELAELESQEERLSKQLKQDQKSLDAEKKQVEDTIAQTTKRRLGDITSSYDKELSKSQEQLKKARSKREKAKNQGVKERIVEETADLRDDNRRIRLQIKTVFQQNHVPGYCNTNWYYALYFPRWLKEFFKLFLAVVVCFLLIPYGIYMAIPKQTTLFLVLIYFACILVFGGIYVLIGNRTRDRYAAALKEGRMLRDQIHANDKKIKVITHTIKRDKNEAIYDLQIYDDEIAQMEQNMAETAAKKKEALNTFETVTKNIIADEIISGAKERIQGKQSLCDTEEQQLKELRETIKSRNIYITDCYGSYLSREFLQPEKLDALADIMENGTAANLSEAMQQYKKKNA